MQCEVSPPALSLCIAANSHAVRESLIEIAAFSMRRGFGTGFSADLQIVLGEVLNNVVEHAYCGTSDGEMVVALTPMPHAMVVQLSDWGRAMPGGKLPEGVCPDVQPIEIYDQPEGGFGWSLIRHFARDLTYRREAGCNILTFCLPDLSE